MGIRTTLAVAIVIITALAGAQAVTALSSLSGTADTSAVSGAPGEQATVGFTITSTGGQSSVALNLSTVPDGVSVDAEASDADGGEFAQGGEEVAYVFPSGTLAPQLVFNISANANDGEEFAVKYEMLNENSTVVSSGTVTITATTALSASATSLSVAGDAGNQTSAEFSITGADGQQRVELDLSDIPSALTVNQSASDFDDGEFVSANQTVVYNQPPSSVSPVVVFDIASDAGAGESNIAFAVRDDASQTVTSGTIAVSITTPLTGDAAEQTVQAAPGGQATAAFQITGTDGQSSVALDLTQVPANLTVNQTASSLDGGTTSDGGTQILYFQPSGPVSPSVAFNINETVPESTVLTIEYAILDENSTPVQRDTVDIEARASLATQFDADGDGRIELAEIQTAIRSFSDSDLSLQEVQQLIRLFETGESVS
jgi:hypothetical protein